LLSAGGTRSCSISRPSPIAEAAARRLGIDATAYRVFHGDGEGIPGLAIDRFDDVAVAHAHSTALLERWLPTLQTDLAEFTVYGKVHERAGHGRSEVLWGTPQPVVEVVEQGVRYEIRPGEGLTVGLFLDMRDVRRWLRAQASKRSVLNLFAYTCSFGVVAALGDAVRVLNLDVSRSYLEWGKRNFALNGLPVGERDFVYGDASDWLQRFARRHERWDLVVVDPPSFSSTPFSIIRDYARLVELAARVISPAGILLAAANHAGTSDGRFDSWLHAGLAAAGRSGHLIERWHEPDVDFPVGRGRWPYLKVRALVLD
jgi:23S rRNA (cytosine1962-C5)-methyltransferase